MPRKKKKTKEVEVAEQTTGVVGTSSGITINLGHFQTARFDCWLTLPTSAQNAKNTYLQCQNFVNERLMQEATKIYQEHKEINGSMKS